MSGTNLENEIKRELSFWNWLARSGLRAFWDRWLALHALVGVALALAVPNRMSSVASTVFLPLASILVGLTFAWGGNALAVLQTAELAEVTSSRSAPGYAAYLHTYQLAILVILATLVLWGLLALGLADTVEPLYRNRLARIAGRTVTFGLTSVAFRECWQVVKATHAGLIVRRKVQDAAEAKRSEGSPADYEAKP